jgi:RNA polymerase subunit RPABC4/transcription elongation factor Spt4
MTSLKNCPNCKAEVETDFEICWNCNYSFSEQKIIDFEDGTPDRLKRFQKQIDCLRCRIPMVFSDSYRFHEGVFGAHLGTRRIRFDAYICPQCDKVEFYAPPGE